VSGDGFAKSEKGYTSTSSAYRQNGSLLRGSRRHAPGPGPRQEGPGVCCVAGDPGRARLRGPEDATADDGLGAAGARGRRLRRARLLHGAPVHRRQVPLRAAACPTLDEIVGHFASKYSTQVFLVSL
jgi:hypothetical protein